jgi:hypothetical protein
MVVDLNHSQNLDVHRRAGGLDVSLPIAVLSRILERQSWPLFGWLLLATPVCVQAQFTYATNNGALTITGYTGTNDVAIIPSTIDGLPVTSIATTAFENTLVNVVSIPSTVTSIGPEAFAYTGAGLSAITVDPANQNYSSVGGVLFDKAQTALVQYPSGAAAASYSIPNTVTNIADSAFNFSVMLASVTIPNSLTHIGGGAFSQCQSLRNVTIPNSVTSIGDNAFVACVSLTSVTIGDGVTSIGNLAFGDCWNLVTITLDSGNQKYSSIGGVLFDKGHTTLIQYPSSKADAFYTIPDTVTNIADSAFYGCQYLTSVTIPNSVTSIGTYAFWWCQYLTNVTISDSITSIPGFAFAGCQRLTSVTIPAGVTSIGEGAFNSCGLITITIPENVGNIGDGAFDDCYSLTTVFFQGNAPPVGQLSFSYEVWGGTVWRAPVTCYYLPGTSGWSTNLIVDGAAAPWPLPYPLILHNSPGFGVQSSGFGFTVSWATNASVLVEASASLSNPKWSPVTTNALSGGTFYFRDPQWREYSSRFYRVRSQ